MALYLTTIIIAVIIITSFNTLFNPMMSQFSPLLVMGMVILGVVIEIAIDAIFAYIVHSLPNRWFAKEKKFFDVSRRERKFYEKLNIKNWKDKNKSKYDSNRTTKVFSK